MEVQGNCQAFPLSGGVEASQKMAVQKHGEKPAGQ